ncbi:helix-turn-helix domain-containing protein [Flavobacteriaceae bacterium S0862]|nr:helix-turn-helix domain-containing protein [Flavobacteriaceae bacterium S0862]
MVKNKITQLHGLEPQDLLTPLDCLRKQLEELKRTLSDKSPAELLSRKEVALLLKTNPQTINNWTNEGKLKLYGLGGRRYYKRNEVEQALIELNQ